MEKDFTQHNAEAAEVWERYDNGEPSRIPMTLGMNARMVILDEELSGGVTFEKYYNDPKCMMETQLAFRRYEAFETVYDHAMGLPERGWHVYPDFQNDAECGWFGAEVKYSGNAVPFTIPLLRDDDKKKSLFKNGIPELFGGLLGKAFEYREYFLRQKEKGFEFLGRPIDSVGFPATGTDGPMTVACMLRGTTEFCLDLYEDPEYALALLEFITEAAIFRIKGLRKYFGQNEIEKSFGFADDSIQLLSQNDYRRFVLPFHKRLINELTDGTGRNSIHLCGDATHHFKTLQDELNIFSFDTGFPINFTKTFGELSRETQISGGVHVHTLLTAKPAEVREAVRKICEEVKPISKRFVIRDANNVSPRTPLENISAMYDAVKEFGRYE